MTFERRYLNIVFVFKVYVTDGRKNDSARVNVSVLNINDWDPRFKYPQYEFYVPQKDKKVGHVVGKLEVHDGDEGDSVTLELKGSFARVFTINKKGQLIIQDLRYTEVLMLLYHHIIFL